MNNKGFAVWIACLTVLLAVAVGLAVFPRTVKDSVNKANTDEKLSDDTVETVNFEDKDSYGNPEDYLYTADGYLIVGGDTDCQHMWNDWILIKASTIKHSGEEMRFCRNCFGKQNREFATLKGEGESVILDVDCILQMPEFPNGCEVVSLTTVLQYLGYPVTTVELIDNHMPRGYFGNGEDDPFYKYLGDPYGLGVGCYAPCIRNTANSYLRSIGEPETAIDVSGESMASYRKYIDEGKPVVFWGTTYMDCNSEVFGRVCINNREVIWRSHSHCFVLIGYTDTTYIFCDPLRGIIEYPSEDVVNSHSLVYRQACVIN